MLLDDVRVLDFTSGIAGAYATKLLADAGAEVTLVEADEGHPLRRRREGRLFEFLSAGKHSVLRADGADWASASGADIAFVGDGTAVAALRGAHPGLVVASITPYGTDGPHASRPATEFTLQAACGSTGHRGLPDGPPLAAGGEIGEWLTGTYAAVGALAALRSARTTGLGEHVDVAMLDCMSVTMSIAPAVFHSLAGWPPLEGTGRTIEVPSVEPCQDGYVVLTPNSAPQFEDLLLLIGRPEWIGDPSMTRVHARFERRQEFWDSVWAWTKQRTVAQVLEETALLRIPAGPLLNAQTVVAFEPFVARRTFAPAASGRFVRPCVPYRIDGEPPPEPGPAPESPTLATPRTTTTATDSGGADAGAATRSHWERPMAGIRVLDLTAWWAGPAATHAMAALGADVIKIESPRRPDGMRFTGVKAPSVEQWWEWGGLYHAANTGKRAITLDLSHPEGVAVFDRLLTGADAVIENFTPRVMPQLGLDWDHLHTVNPRVISVSMPAFGSEGPWRDRTGFAQTMEAVSGMAHVTGFPDGPPVLVRGCPDPLAGMHAVFVTLAALAQRDRDGKGHRVEVVMVEAALNAAAEAVIEYSATGEVWGRTGNLHRTAAPQGVYRCAGIDEWVALAAVTAPQWQALVATVPGLDRAEWADEQQRHRDHDALDAVLGAWTAQHSAAEAARRLQGAGVPAEVVIAARDMVRNDQLRHRNLLEAHDHPVCGTHEIPAFPVRFSRVKRWTDRPAPLLGQHNVEVLGEAGLGPSDLAALQDAGVIADRLPT